MHCDKSETDGGSIASIRAKPLQSRIGARGNLDLPLTNLVLYREGGQIKTEIYPRIPHVFS